MRLPSGMPPIGNCCGRALRSGVIDMVATDHSPCPPELKCLEQGNFARAWGGIASLSIALPVMWTSAKQRGADITGLWSAGCAKERPRWQASNHAKGGSRRDMMPIWSYSIRMRVFEVTRDRLHFRHPISPYIGERLEGEVKMTFVRGHRVFANGSFADEKPGIEALP